MLNLQTFASPQIFARPERAIFCKSAPSISFHFLPLEGLEEVKNTPSISFHFGGREPFRVLPGMEWNGMGCGRKEWKTRFRPSIFHLEWKDVKNTTLDEQAIFCTIGGRA